MSTCVGCGLNVDGSGLLSVELRPCGGLACQNTGAVNDGLYLATSIVDTATIDMNGDGQCTTPLSANVRRSTAACNGIRLDADGIWAPCPQEFTCSRTAGFYGGTIPIALNTAGAALFTLNSTCLGSACNTCPGGVNDRIRFCNPSTCCTLEGFWDVQAYGGAVNGDPGFNATAELQISTNGGAFVPAFPPTTIRMQNNTAAVQTYDLSGMLERNYVTLAASACVDLQAAVQIHVFAATGTWTLGPSFEFHFGPLVQTGCC